MAPRAIEAANLQVKLFPTPIERSWVIEGNPKARSCTLSKSSDGFGWTVVWECTKGKFNWYYGLDETILILEGSIILDSDSLTPTRYVSGDTILFRKGAHARWHVEEYVKKLAFCHRVQPAIVGFAVRSLGPIKRKLSSQRHDALLPHGPGAL
jgi:uncharacterized protein